MLDATVAVTAPLPVPDAPLTVRNAALLTAVHEHALPAVTVTVIVPPPLPTDAAVGVTVKLQGGGTVRNVSVGE